MKRTILLTLALAGAASATTYTLDTALLKQDDGSSISAFEAALNQTQAQANDVAGIANAGLLHFSSSNVPTVTFTLSSMYGADALPEETLYLTSLSFLSRPDSSYHGYAGSSVTVTVNGQSVTSNIVSADIPSNNNAFREVVWTFDGTLAFSSTDTLTVTFTRGSATGTTNIGMGSFQTESGYSYEGTSKVYTYGSNEYYNFFRLRLIPEPMTATLSLLALAGLAARRRRK